MAKKNADQNVDIRALKLNMTRGKITKKEYEDHLKSLPDLSKDMSEIPAYFEEEEEVMVHDSEEAEAAEAADDLTFSVV